MPTHRTFFINQLGGKYMWMSVCKTTTTTSNTTGKILAKNGRQFLYWVVVVTSMEATLGESRFRS
jgi:hypothetical protein